MPRSQSSSRRREDPRREARIVNEIVVDAYGPDERALGWYYYLEAHLRFPFEATCMKRRATSPLKVGETVTITGLAPEDDCRGDMLVLTTLLGRPLGVPLSQLQAHELPAAATEAIADWHYWSSVGYRF